MSPITLEFAKKIVEAENNLEEAGKQYDEFKENTTNRSEKIEEIIDTALGKQNT